ncbi:transglutaminase TgpA family protein [Thermincola potens]|uniref:Transglutaminase domain protein n=1 Tax=Thermincola potens (strain JR) TaxID=635013 RepID=D5XCM6_THEPJ|nr:transglutaminaseTgpA domain-containing protein [Thermincola potens]ADG81652.1 transglutaminase domain protein [Thermincola potens JR]
MQLVKHWREWFLIPFLIFGYMETLRRITFLAFGTVSQGYAFSIVTVLVVFAVVLDFYCRRRWLNALYKIISVSYIIGVVFFNYFSHNGPPAVGLWSLPLIKNSIGNAGQPDMIFFFIFIFYAVLVYLLAFYLLERKSLTELTAASALLLSVEIASAKVDISFLVIAHIVFILLLRSQTFYLYLISRPEFKETDNQRTFGRRWVATNLVITSVIIILALLAPHHGTGLAITSEPVKWAKGKIMQKAGQIARPAMTQQKTVEGDGFHKFWDRLETFEFKGAVQSSDELVMSVRSPRPFYWRGESADYYNGKGWVNSFKMKEIFRESENMPNPYGPNVPTQRIEQVFTLAPRLSSTVIFTASPPEKVMVPDRFFWIDGGGNLYTREMKSGAHYKVVSYIPEFSEKQLRRVRVDYDQEPLRHYLQLPENLPERVREKAMEITKGLYSPYDKAKAIERYLSQNFPYTLEVQSPKEGRDVVDYFLFDLKKGYCTYHSTAMVVMLRTLGIPARWVKGFATGTYDAQTGNYMVKEGDAHAWVEVYFGEYGWVPFEPTASFKMPAVQNEPVSVEAAASAEDDGTQAANMVVTFEEGVQEGPWDRILFFAGGFIIALTSIRVIFFWRELRQKMQLMDEGRVRDYYLDMVYLLESKGITRSYDQTPYEFAGKVCESFPAIQKEVILLTEGYLKEQYGNYKTTAGQHETFKKAWDTIVAVLTKR